MKNLLTTILLGALLLCNVAQGEEGQIASRNVGIVETRNGYASLNVSKSVRDNVEHRWADLVVKDRSGICIVVVRNIPTADLLIMRDAFDRAIQLRKVAAHAAQTDEIITSNVGSIGVDSIVVNVAVFTGKGIADTTLQTVKGPCSIVQNLAPADLRTMRDAFERAKQFMVTAPSKGGTP